MTPRNDLRTAVLVTLGVSLACTFFSVYQLVSLKSESHAEAGQRAGTVAPMISQPCEFATARLHGMYREVQTCVTDMDCNYVDDFFNVMARSNTDGFVKTFDCRSISPFLVFGNGSWIQSDMERLKKAQSSQLAACESHAKPVNCSLTRGFIAKSPPVCRAGACQATVAEQPVIGGQDGRS
jgi:hypothetical protein